jgi:hypothetical protein
MALPFGPLSLPVQDAHGRILIAGGKVDPVTKARVSYLARFDAQMNLDTSFGADGTGLAALRNPTPGWLMPTTVTVDDEDRIVLGGRVISAGGPYSSQYNEAVTRLKGDRGATSTVIEFYNASLDHYFMTWAPREISDLDTGVHRGWARTGQTFNTYTTSPAGTSSVCRFYIPPALGDSHFFGRDAVECVNTGLKYPGLLLESRNFMQMYLPIAGVCPAAATPVYRVFSNRPDANHRYMTDRAVRDQMVAKGWLAEGDGPDLVVMCAPQ